MGVRAHPSKPDANAVRLVFYQGSPFAKTPLFKANLYPRAGISCHFGCEIIGEGRVRSCEATWEGLIETVTATMCAVIQGTRKARPQPRRVTAGRVLRGILANPVPPTEPLQLAISPPQGLHPGLAVAFTAKKSAEFGHRPDRIAERQGLPGRPDRLLGGGEALQDGDFGGRERHRRRLIWIDPHRVGHPQEPPCDNGIPRDRPFQPLTGFSWKVFDMTPSGFPREMQAFNPPARAIPGHDALGVCCRGHRQRGDE